MIKNNKLSIGNSIFVYFTITAIVATLLISLAIYSRLSLELSKNIKEENINLVSQVNAAIDKHIRGVMKLSDTIYYNTIKNTDISDKSITRDMTLLYDNNKEIIENIAIFSANGDLLTSVPAARLRKEYVLNAEPWFVETLIKNDSIYFSKPHIQFAFIQNENTYKWVITMARAIEINKDGKSEQAILLIDIAYSGIARLLDNISFGPDSYIFLTDSKGDFIYHPKLQLIYSGLEKENNIEISSYSDGISEEKFEGINRNIVIKSVGYTAWKVVGVSVQKGISLDKLKAKLFMVFIVSCIIFMVSSINAYISYIITDPIKELEKSVNELEKGNMDANIYIGGSYEIMHLGKSIKSMSARIKNLMQTIVREHEEKRKSEFDTLQSQINPHFLYNTLDIIVWMVENEKKSEAVKVVTSLARFFRISLSKGKSIISVRDEIEHVKNYLMIQQMRFKNKFNYEINVEEDVWEYSSLKLMLQPLVENAIYHGMEFMDGDGLVSITVKKEEDKLYFTISDNGLGMTKEQVDSLLSKDFTSKSKKGSGIGVKNVNERIKLYFGIEYGLSIESEPDEGTKIRLTLPVRRFGDNE